MRWSRQAGVGATLATAAFGAVGCGGDDEPAVDRAADRARVEEALLTVDDLPAGFAPEPVDDPEDDGEVDECLEEEIGITRDEFEAARTARSERVQFASETTSLRARVSAFTDPDVPGDVIDAFDEDAFLRCLEGTFRDDPEMAELEVGRLEAIDPLVGDEATAYQLRLELVAQGIELESRLSALLVDRFVVSIEATAVRGAIDEELLADALNTMADRVQAEG